MNGKDELFPIYSTTSKQCSSLSIIYIDFLSSLIDKNYMSSLCTLTSST